MVLIILKQICIFTETDKYFYNNLDLNLDYYSDILLTWSLNKMNRSTLSSFVIDKKYYAHVFDNDNDSTYIINSEEVILYEVDYEGSVLEYTNNIPNKCIGNFKFNPYPNWVFVANKKDTNQIHFNSTDIDLIQLEFLFFKNYITSLIQGNENETLYNSR